MIFGRVLDIEIKDSLYSAVSGGSVVISLNMKLYIALFFFAFLGVPTVNAEPPRSTKSEYISTESAGFMLANGEGVFYSLAFAIRQEIKYEMYGIVLFENPINREKPLVKYIVISKGQKEIAVQSPLIKKIENGKTYKVVFVLFKDAKKTKIINRHVQKIEFSLPVEMATQLGLELISPRQDLIIENWSIAFDPDRWSEGYRTEDSEQTVIEYVLKGESVENWSKLVTSQTIFSKIDPEWLYNYMIEDLKKDCPSLKTSIITKSKKSILFEWHRAECEGHPSQHELRKIVVYKNKTYAIALSRKNNTLSANSLERWIASFKSAEIKL